MMRTRDKNVERLQRCIRSQLGLTLIELLVAISVLGFVAVLGWRGLDGIVRARIALTRDLEQTRGMQLTFAQIQSDCTHLADNSLIPDRMPLTTDKDKLILIRMVYAFNQPSRLQVVSYRLKDDKLLRQESTPTRDLNVLDTQLLAAINDLESAPSVTLQTDVSALSMRTWINGGWRNTMAVQTSSSPATPTVAAQIPTGLEVTLRLHDSKSDLTKIFLLGAV
jgi:general secretion pathway protein J